MKLYCSQRKRDMFNSHDHTIFAFSCNSQLRRQHLAHCVQRVITARREFARKLLKDAAAQYADGRCFAMYRLREVAQFAAEMLDHSLQTQTDAEYGQSRRERG